MGRPKASRERAITIDSLRVASRDLFCLIVDIDKLLRANDISSLQFVSDTLSSETQYEQIGYIIAALQVLRSHMEMEDSLNETGKEEATEDSQ